jgi:RHS repeat-associated protein
MRYSKTVEGITTTHIWDGANIIIDITNNTQTRYIRGIGLIYSDINGTRSYFLFNGRGDVIQLTNSNGAVIINYDYDAFGNERDSDPYDTNPWRFNGEYWDNETETYYLRFRYYNPRTGRFTTEDPIRDGLNWYTYCGNNPIIFIDPWGLASDNLLERFLNFYTKAVLRGRNTNIVFSRRIIDINFARMSLSDKHYNNNTR